MADVFTAVMLGLFGVSTMALAIYGLHLYVLVGLFRRRSALVRQNQRAVIAEFRARAADRDWPLATTQIPIYNEADVAARVIQAAARMRYPAGRHEIQVLDDSTDHTSLLIDETAQRLRSDGIDITVVRRPERVGYKAGALAHGLARARGELIAVFDADFVPPADFLTRLVPLLEADPELACLQARWDHLNERESWLTRAQALGIDGHFAIEQGARAWNGLLMNFNGTAGVWRKAAIQDPAVGGWHGDTLTEDLDLSYRVQLAGWRIDYALDVPCPAELPGTVGALKSQQRRWATGSIQVARKLLPRIWSRNAKGGGLTWIQKLEATLHLTHYTVALWMLILALVARPMLLIWMEGKAFSDWFWLAWAVVILSAIAPSLAYGYARYTLGGGLGAVRVIPLMLILGTGLCLNNAVAVLRGLRLKGGEFVRTPKSGSLNHNRKVSSYCALPARGTRTGVQASFWGIELALGAYAAWSFWHYLDSTRWAFSIFLLIYAIGFLTVGWLSRPERPSCQPRRAPQASRGVSRRPGGRIARAPDRPAPAGAPAFEADLSACHAQAELSDANAVKT